MMSEEKRVFVVPHITSVKMSWKPFFFFHPVQAGFSLSKSTPRYLEHDHCVLFIYLFIVFINLHLAFV